MTGRYVVMGVAGSGKTTVGRRLAELLDAAFADADDLHPPANVVKMAAGTPLSDADREPWLVAVRDVLAGEPPVVVTCSALKRGYRDVLRTAGDVVFAFLDVTPAVAADRVGGRTDHFMPAGLVASQFETLERPVDEPDVVTVEATGTVDEVVDAVAAALTR